MNYQVMATKTASDKCKNLSNLSLGIMSEAGECADIVKKHLHHEDELNSDRLVEKFGDICWYIALGCEVLGTDFNKMLAENIQKLKSRYPENFTNKNRRWTLKMCWLINYIKSLFCKHEGELIFDIAATDRLFGDTYHSKTYRCCKCGYSKRYKSC